jgi:hypothetical protein
MEPEGSLQSSWEPLDQTKSYMNPVNLASDLFKAHFNIILTSISVFQVVSFRFFSSLPYVLHAPPISSSLIWSTY